MASTWIAYNDLAWTEDWLVDPSDYEEEVQFYVDRIQRATLDSPRTLLHLGCGAGGQDTIFKRHFAVTGVDLSAGMLQKARSRHPEIEYIEADMRTLRLNRQFDVVVIPDSIDYMATQDELRQAIQTAAMHLRAGGVLLIVGNTAETFQNNNFAYTGEKDGVHVTLFENNYINPFRPNCYEATLVYLIRQKGELTLHTDRHVLGLFPLEIWQMLFKEAALTLTTEALHGLYDKYLLDEGEYPLTIFIGQREK